MHRWLVPLLVVVLVGAVFVGSPTSGGRAGQPEASPAASPAAGSAAVPMRFFRELLGFVRFGEEPDDQFLVLTRVSLAANQLARGDTAMDSHPHGGPSLLFVESGSVCYRLHDDENDNAAVRVFTGPSLVSDAFVEDVDCPRPPEECLSGCDVASPVAILLMAGETVSHRGAVTHDYQAVGRTGAVVYISELQPNDEGLPCSGGCH